MFQFNPCSKSVRVKLSRFREMRQCLGNWDPTMQPEDDGAEPVLDGQEETQDVDTTFTESIDGLRKLLKKREKELDERSAELKRQRTLLEQEHPTFDAKPSDVLRLNVGGTKIDVLRRTLTCIEGSLLASQFSGRWDNSLAKDAEGNFFIDQKFDLFLILVNYLRDRENDTQLAPPLRSPSFVNGDESDEKSRISFLRMLEHFNITLGVYPFSLNRIASGGNVQVMKGVYPGDMVKNESGSVESYMLDAAEGSGHSFRVKSFEVAVEKGSNICVGVGICYVTLQALPQAHSKGSGVGYTTGSIAVDVSRQGIAYLNAPGPSNNNLPTQVFTPIAGVFDGALIRCEDFGMKWYVNGKLVASATGVGSGVIKIRGFARPPQLSTKWPPILTIHSGSVRFTAIELDWAPMH